MRPTELERIIGELREAVSPAPEYPNGVIARLELIAGTFNALVEALKTARRDLRDYGAAPIQQVCEEMKQALDAAKS